MGIWGPCPSAAQCKAPDGGLGQKLTILFCETMLFCHGLKNGIAILHSLLQVFNMKLKNNF